MSNITAFCLVIFLFAGCANPYPGYWDKENTSDTGKTKPSEPYDIYPSRDQFRAWLKTVPSVNSFFDGDTFTSEGEKWEALGLSNYTYERSSHWNTFLQEWASVYRVIVKDGIVDDVEVLRGNGSGIPYKGETAFPTMLYERCKKWYTERGNYPYSASVAYEGYFHRFDPQYHYPVTYEVYNTYDSGGHPTLNPFDHGTINGGMEYCITSFTPLE